VELRFFVATYGNFAKTALAKDRNATAFLGRRLLRWAGAQVSTTEQARRGTPGEQLSGLEVAPTARPPDYTPTPDRRYFVVRGRLWRLSNPALDKQLHAELVQELMTARRAVRNGGDSVERIAARLKVDAAKRKLGERGPVWWTDGAPDYNRYLVKNTPYATWFASHDPNA
jgi:hypothetical protein